MKAFIAAREEEMVEVQIERKRKRKIDIKTYKQHTKEITSYSRYQRANFFLFFFFFFSFFFFVLSSLFFSVNPLYKLFSFFCWYY